MTEAQTLSEIIEEAVEETLEEIKDEIQKPAKGVRKKAVRQRKARGIKVIAVRKIGVDDEKIPGGVRMVQPGEEVVIPRDAAIKLQDAFAIKVVI